MTYRTNFLKKSCQINQKPNCVNQRKRYTDGLRPGFLNICITDILDKRILFGKGLSCVFQNVYQQSWTPKMPRAPHLNYDN